MCHTLFVFDIVDWRSPFCYHALRQKRFCFEPCFEVAQQRCRMFVAMLLTELRVTIACCSFDFVQPTDDGQRMVSSG